MPVRSRRRRSSVLSGIDPSNVISFEEPGEICPRRKSLRLLRKSTQFKITPCGSPNCVDENQRMCDLPSTVCDHPVPPSQSPPLSSLTDSPVADKLPVCSPEASLNSLLLVSCVSPIDAVASLPVPLKSIDVNAILVNSHADSSSQSPPAWIKARYSPPKLKGLDAIPEGRLLQMRPTNKRSKVSLTNTFRLQVFTGQTLDEACLPNCPGGTRLDPKFVRNVAQRRVRSRQLKAKRMGFRGIPLSDRVERRMSQFYRSFRDLSASPSS